MGHIGGLVPVLCNGAALLRVSRVSVKGAVPANDKTNGKAPRWSNSGTTPAIFRTTINVISHCPERLAARWLWMGPLRLQVLSRSWRLLPSQPTTFTSVQSVSVHVAQHLWLAAHGPCRQFPVCWPSALSARSPRSCPWNWREQRAAGNSAAKNAAALAFVRFVGCWAFQVESWLSLSAVDPSQCPWIVFRTRLRPISVVASRAKYPPSWFPPCCIYLVPFAVCPACCATCARAFDWGTSEPPWRREAPGVWGSVGGGFGVAWEPPTQAAPERSGRPEIKERPERQETRNQTHRQRRDSRDKSAGSQRIRGGK